MSTKLHITGKYEEKIEIGHVVISHHKGSFDFMKEVGEANWSQTYGPVTIHESVSDAKVVVTVSAFGMSEVIFKTGLTGTKPFKIEIDRGNKVEGQVQVLAGVAAVGAATN